MATTVDFIDLIRQIRGASPLETINAYVGDSAKANNPVTMEEGMFQRFKDKEKYMDNVYSLSDGIKTTLWGSDPINGSTGTVLERINTSDTSAVAASALAESSRDAAVISANNSSASETASALSASSASDSADAATIGANTATTKAAEAAISAAASEASAIASDASASASEVSKLASEISATASSDSADASEVSRLASDASAVASSASETNASASETKSSQWAETAKGTEVPGEVGNYSAKHHALTAKDSADASALSASESSDSASEAAISAGEALDSKNTIVNLTAGASTLTPGSNATASFNSSSGLMSFGIPKGDKGDIGEAFHVDADGPIADRGLYDSQPKGYAFLSTDEEPTKIYFKISDIDEDNWSVGAPFGKGDQGEQGVGISTVARTTGDGSAGTVDTYTITYTDATTSTFDVTNGTANLVDSVAGKTGEVVLDKADVGLSDVDNTSDADKPVSTAAQTVLSAKADIDGPTFTGTVGGITKSMVGLSDVDNTSDADKNSATATLTNKTITTPLGIVKSDVGLSEVDNTSDANKPISDATQTALSVVSNKVVDTSTSNVLIGDGNLALDNFAITKNFAAVTYTGNDDTQDIVTGISSVDFTASSNGSGFWHDRGAGDCTVKSDAGDVVDEGSCVCSTFSVRTKRRDDVGSNIVVDGLRGTGVSLLTDTTDTEGAISVGVNSTGIVLNANDANIDTATYIAYQTLYTHIRWGLTNQNKRYIEAYNPVTRETMVMYQGSDSTGHEIPHSLGVELGYSEIKALTLADKNWMVQWDKESKLWLNFDNASVDGSGDFSRAVGYEIVQVGTSVNHLDDTYILYGKANSETWTIVEYVGTGAAGNFVETLDINGVARKPRRVIVKRVDGTGNWLVVDSKRETDSLVFLNLTDAEAVNNSVIAFGVNGFTLNNNSGETNVSGGQYIALIEFDTNSNGGDSYFDLPTDDSSLNITDGTFTYTDGIDGNGFVRSSEQITESIDFAGVSDGLKWVGKKLDGSGYIFEDKKPSVGLYEKESADDNRLVFDVESGKYYTTIGGELITNGTFDVDTSGWTSIVYNGSTYETSTSSLTWNSGMGKIVNPTGKDYAAIEQELSGLTIGAKYVAQATFDTSDTGYFSIGESSAIGNGATSGEGFQSSDLTTGVYTIEFTATASSMYVTLQLSTNVDEASLYVDDISVYKLEPTIDQPIATPVSFLPNPVMVASETPMDIREDDELLTNVMDSLDVGKVKASKLSITDGFDLGQTWVDTTSERALGVAYLNTTGKTIMVTARVDSTSDTAGVRGLVDEISTYYDYQTGGGQTKIRNSVILAVPPMSTYQIDKLNAETLIYWQELR